MLIYDGNGITRHPEEKDVRIYRIDATEESVKMSSAKGIQHDCLDWISENKTSGRDGECDQRD